MKYYKDGNGNLFEDPIVKNHIGLIQISKSEFDTLIIEKNTPTQAQLNAQRVIEIDTELRELDILSIRPMRAKSRGKETTFDAGKIIALDEEVEVLRVERSKLV